MSDPHQHRRVTDLTKSRFLAGWQCPKRLWLECYSPDILSPLNEVELARIEVGKRVGELAQKRFSKAILVRSKMPFPAAVRDTEFLLGDESIGGICEAALLQDAVRIRSDILLRRDNDRWDLIEVKSTSAAKEEHILDLAIQAHVLRGCAALTHWHGLKV